MDSISRFSTKAERYAHFRWGYAPEAFQAIFDLTGLGSHIAVADIGAGTGLLTKELVGRADTIYAVEPNLAMRQIAECLLYQHPSFVSLDGKAEATTLQDQSVDLITVGQAIHWFEPESTLKEFQRILRPEGWLAVLFHTKMKYPIFETLYPIFTKENGWDLTPSPKPRHGDSHADFYFNNGRYKKLSYPQNWQESWEIFIGGILSDSHSPDDSHPAFPKLVSAIREVFDQFSVDETIQILGGTELILGNLRKGLN